jgi:ClpP class serine protease
MTGMELIWLFFLISSLQPVISQRWLEMQRFQALRALERKNGSRAITLIHRREGFSFLGIPFGGFIDIDDSEAVIRAIEMTSNELPIDFIIHTPGGLVLAAEQIASSLAAHPGKVTVFVPHYAMSGGTLIAMGADQIVLAPSAVLGPLDPQLGEMPAASILVAVSKKDPNEVDDKTLILADVATKAQAQVRTKVQELLSRLLDADKAAEIATTMTDGRWTHDFPIDVNRAQSLGLPVSTDLPNEIRDLMKLYPQPRGRRPSVEYIPIPYGKDDLPPAKSPRGFPGRSST